MDINSVITTDYSAITFDVVFGHDASGAPFGLTIVGSDSPQYHREEARQRAAGRRMRAQNDGEGLDITTEAGGMEFDKLVEGNKIAFAVAVAVNWFGFEEDGRPAMFDTAKVLAMMEKRKSWREMVLSAIDKGANFLPMPQTGLFSTSNS